MTAVEGDDNVFKLILFFTLSTYCTVEVTVIAIHVLYLALACLLCLHFGDIL